MLLKPRGIGSSSLQGTKIYRYIDILPRNRDRRWIIVRISSCSHLSNTSTTTSAEACREPSCILDRGLRISFSNCSFSLFLEMARAALIASLTNGPRPGTLIVNWAAILRRIWPYCHDRLRSFEEEASAEQFLVLEPLSNSSGNSGFARACHAIQPSYAFPMAVICSFL